MKKFIQSTISVILLMFCTATVSAQTEGLSVGSGTSFTLEPGCMLTLPGTLTNSGTFTIACNATEEGSLIIGDSATGSGTFIRQQYIVNDDSWHMIASASQNSTIVGSDFVPATSGGVLATNFDFYSFDQSKANNWINIRSSDKSVNNSFETDFTAGKGYLVAYSSSYGKTTFEFNGSFNSGNVSTPALTFTPGANWAGWNMIGNPYTSAIDWSKADLSAFTDNFAYVYDPNKAGGAGYDEIDGGTSGAYLAPGQAFFVNVSASGSFTFTPEMQLHHTETTLKSAEVSQSNSQLILRLSSNSHYDETTIRLMSGTKSARDRDDALELPGFDNSVPQLYSYTSDSVKVAINTYPEIDSVKTVLLGTIIPKNGTYTFSLQSFSGAFASQHALLEDLSNDSVTDLTDKNYAFKGKTTDTRRFILFMDKINGISKTTAKEKILLYAYEGRIYIQSKDGNPLFGEVKVDNMLGDEVYHEKLSGIYRRTIQTQIPAGVYVVDLTLKDGTRVVKKVILAN